MKPAKPLHKKHVKHFQRYFLNCSIITALAVPVPALAVNIETSYGKRHGDITYQIGGQFTIDSALKGRARFPLSELRFQTNTPIVSASLSHLFNEEWMISALVTKNTNSSAGQMQDSDWGLNYSFENPQAFPRDSLDIYSESRLKMSSLDIKIDLHKKVNVNFLPLWEIFVGAGIYSQRYDFETFDTIQSYPSTPERPKIILDEKTLIYRYDSTMPFVSLKMKHHFSEKFLTSLFINYSPWLQVSDYDNHILRKKTSEGESDGWGIIFDVGIKYLINKRIHIQASVNYLKTVANGIQSQQFPEDSEFDSAEIGLRNTSEQTSASIGISYAF